ncbi:MAG TPA: DUF2252 family protein [Caldilineaceae bacterium]|nr:DUF2252 family protein [Caldilineaceae bacterium]
MLVIQHVQTEDRDRTEEFSLYAKERAEGTVRLPPLLLPKTERWLHVRQTLREDHQFRIKNNPEGAQDKFDKLAKSFFKFFRGTALLFYRDYAGMDSHLPTVFTIGDVHPENFGVMPNEDGAPIFGVNDFDEAYFAPFSYDLKRGAVGFYIAAKENGLKKKKRREVVRAFVDGYWEGLTSFARDDREKWHEFRIDNSPKMIRKLLKSARTERADFLADLIDVEKERFISSDEIVPHSKHIAEFQKVVDTYREDNDIDSSTKAEGFFEVRDVAIKRHSGTASLGLDRYFVLINGPTDDPTDDIILEFKQTRPSAIYGLAPNITSNENGKTKSSKKSSKKAQNNKASRVVRSHDIHLSGGDPYYGQVDIDDENFLVRERSPYKDDIDVDDLDYDEFCEYASICGQALAQTHARSDEDTGIMEGDAEKRILSSVNPALFTADVVRFAHTATKRLKRDWKMFKQDHALGAFQFYQQ